MFDWDMLVLQRSRGFLHRLRCPVVRHRIAAPFSHRRSGCPYRCEQRGVDFGNPSELDQAPRHVDEPVLLVRLQPHIFEMVVDRFLMLAKFLAGLAQALPGLGGVGTNRGQGAERTLGRGVVTFQGLQLAQPVQRIGVFGLNLQDAPVADFRVGKPSLPVQFGRVSQDFRDAPGVDAAADIFGVLGLQHGADDLALRAAERIFVRLVSTQEIVFGKTLRNRVANAEGMQDDARGRPSNVSSRPVM